MSTPVLSARGISVDLAGRRVVDNVTLDLPGGRFVMLIGPNGAGKTTLLRALGGLVPANGAVSLMGEPLATLPMMQRARRIAYLPQGHAIHWPLAARDVVALGLYPFGLADPARMSAEQAARVEAAMARTDTLAFADRRVDRLSGGERARVLLARVLVTGAPVVLADEPIAALDPRHQLAIMADLKAEAARGTLVIAVTHDLALAARMADRLLLMSGGRLVAEGPPGAVLTDANLAQVYGVAAYRAEQDGCPVLLPWRVTGP